METKMTEPYAPKKAPPQLSGHPWHVKSSHTSRAFKLMEKWRELGTERKLRERVLVPLGAKANYHVFKVNIAERQAGFTEPATLFPRDHIADAHPFGLDFQGREDLIVFGIGNARLARWRVDRHAEAFAWIDCRVTGLYGFVHQNAEQTNFNQGRVFGDCVAADFCMALLSPLNEIADMRPRQLTRNVDLLSRAKRADIVPAYSVALQGQRGMDVTVVKKTVHPRAPHFLIGDLAGFGSGKLAAQFASLSRFGDDRPAQLEALLSALAREINKLCPIKPAALI